MKRRRPRGTHTDLGCQRAFRSLAFLNAWLSSWSASYYIWGLAVLAIGLRLLWVAVAPNIAVSDAASYENLAARLARGMGYVRSWSDPVPTAYRPPGYPTFLAALYAIFGRSHWVVGVAQGFLGALSCLCTYGLGAKIVGEGPGRLAGLALAAYPNHIYHTSVVMSETLFVALMLSGLYVLAQRPQVGMRAALIAGVLGGLSALVKPEVLLLWLLVTGWMLLRERGARGAVVAVIFAASVGAVIAPWIVRNARVMNAPMLISSNAGVNFYIGNHRGATGGYHYPDGNPLLAYESETTRSREGFHLGLRFIREHPAEWVLLAPRKLLLLALGEVDGVQWGFGGARWPAGRPLVVGLGIIASLVYWPVLILGLMGMVKFGFRSYRAMLLLLVPISWAISHVVFFGGPRFHFPLIPVFLLFTAAFLFGKSLPVGSGAVGRHAA